MGSVAKPLPLWKVWASFHDVVVIVKGRDEDDAQRRFIDVVIKDPDILLRRMTFESVTKAPEGSRPEGEEVGNV